MNADLAALQCAVAAADEGLVYFGIEYGGCVADLISRRYDI